MTRDELQRVRNWADDKIGTGEEPSWLWYQHMKLRECLDAIIGGMECKALEWGDRPAVLDDDVIQWKDDGPAWHDPNGHPTYDPQTGLRLVASNPGSGGAQPHGQKATANNPELEDKTVRLLKTAY